jgi:hypothetical protein
MFSSRLMVDCEHRSAPLSGQRPTASFRSGSPSQPVEIVAVLVAAADRQRARLDQLDQRMLDPARIATIGEAAGEPRADANRALSLPQQQQPSIRGLAAAIEIDCELLAADGWQIEGKQRSFGHGGVALGSGREALVWQRIATPSQRPAPHPSTNA